MSLANEAASSSQTMMGSARTTPRSTIRRPTFRLSDIWRAPLHDFPIRDEIVYQYLLLSPDMHVLEIGPGSGFTAFRLARRVRRFTLVDVAAENVVRLREALHGIETLNVLCADVCKPNLNQAVGSSVDAVFALEVFELLPDPAACLRNLAAVLRPGGDLLIQFPNYPPPRSPGVTCFPSKEELGRMLAAAGFTSWEIYALQLRPHARIVYHLHEQPLRLYRRLRSRLGSQRPLVYDQSWAFRRGERLEPFKQVLHSAWTILFAALRLGGDVFERKTLGSDILNHNLLVVARR